MPVRPALKLKGKDEFFPGILFFGSCAYEQADLRAEPEGNLIEILFIRGYAGVSGR